MLSSRYVHLHEALGLGAMWFKRGVRVVDAAALPESAADADGQTALQVAAVAAPATALVQTASQRAFNGEDGLQVATGHSVAASTFAADADKPSHQIDAAADVVDESNAALLANRPPEAKLVAQNDTRQTSAVAPAAPHPSSRPPRGTPSPLQAIRQELQVKGQRAPSDAKQQAETPLVKAQMLWSSRPAVPEQAADCTACGLHQERRQVLMMPSDSAPLMVLSLNPALQDDDESTLFAGSHGRLLHNMLAAIGLRAEDVHCATWLRCTPRLNLKPTLEEQIACTAHLQAEIQRQQPQALLLLGERFADEEQQWLLQQAAPNLPHFIVPHPAVLLQNPLQKARAWPVLRALRQSLRMR